MQLNQFMNQLNNGFLWISRLAFLNLLWLLFTAAGLVIFGFFPATAATMLICKKWLGGEEVKMFTEFRHAYKQSFITVNQIGLFFAVAGLILYLNFLVIKESGTNILFLAAFYLISFFFIVTATHLLPLYVYEKQGFRQLLKKAFMISLVNMHFSLAIFISQSALYYLLFSYPAAALFFLGSVLSLVQIWFADCSFRKVQRKANAILKTNKKFFVIKKSFHNQVHQTRN